ncbi:MAG: isocitrate lyase/PEP mutase family protein [Alphaproteobacteria bacterium]
MANADIGVIFRALHHQDKAFVIPNPWDVGSAKILEGLGFSALATTSSGFAAGIGKSDGKTTRDETLAHCQELVTATPLPISADLEQGYGDRPEDAAETVRAAAAAGLAGCSIEDYSGAEIYDFAHAVERAQAAVEAARSLPHDFVLTLRAENLIRQRPDLDDTIKRLQAFDEAGADVLYAPGLKDIKTVRTVCSSVTKPVNILLGGTTDMTVDAVSAAGAKRISVGGGLTWVAYGAMIKAARRMLEDGVFDYGDTPGNSGVTKLIKG